MGPSSFANGNCSIAIGGASKTFGPDQINIGDGSTITDCTTLAPPYIAIGKNTLYQSNTWNVQTRGSINIGYENVHCFAGVGIIIGNKNCQNNTSYSNAPYNESIIIGWDNYSNSSYSAIFGTENDMNGNTSYAYGRTNTINGTSNLVYGNSNTTNGNNAKAYGDGNNVNATQGMAYGVANTVTHACAIALGHGITSVADCVAHVPALYVKTTVTAADNATAISCGLVVGEVYKTATGDLKIVY